jgi:predicted metal-dependent HD superfamily phosphohydrolase
MSSWGLSEHTAQYHELVAAHGEPQRRYHTAEHVQECLRQLDRAVDLAEVLREVEMALWFHDGIYKPRSKSNERRSAEWARTFLERAGAESAGVDQVVELIMATRHDSEPPQGDATLVVDIDLSILGAPSERYAVFEEQIRAEYRWVPSALYRRRRREVLESFVARARIYGTEMFHDNLEAAARLNLAEAIDALQLGS